MSTTLYSYLDGSGEYAGPCAAVEDPLEPGIFHAPRNTTAVSPPEVPAGQQAVWGGDAWRLTPDHRGETWFDGVNPIEVHDLGDPATFTPALTAAPPPPLPPDLSRYALAVQSRVLAAGKVFNVAADGQPALNVLCDGLNSTRADLALMILNAQDDPDFVQTWVDNHGVSTDLNASQILALSKAAGKWMSQTYPVLGRVLAGIAASPPTITKTDQVDAAFAASTS